MGKIIVLDELTANKIAAGEVIERPASVVKEMVENSIDAGATNIQVEIRSGGIKYIRITDNGQGFDPDDAVLAFDKHATSKIRTADDLESITTLGFRGEALASIAAVSDVKLMSKTQDAQKGVYINIKGGSLIEAGETGCAKGTVFEIRDLFFNTPARYKFLKKDSTEAGYVAKSLENIALCNPEVAFKLVSNGETILQTPGNGDLKSCIYSIYGRDVATAIKEVKYEESNVTVTGYVSDISLTYSNRNRQTIFVNGRHIKSKLVTAALDQAYKTLTMKGKFPFAVLAINLNPHHVDVNVHPAKIEVRFDDENLIFNAVYRAVSNALLGREIKPTINVSMPSPVIQQPERKPADFKQYEKYLHVKEEGPKEEEKTYVPEVKQISLINREEEEAEEQEQEQKPEIKEPVKADNLPKEEPKIFERISEPVSYINNKVTVNEVTEEKDSRDELFEEARIIGQVWNTYILMEYKSKLLLMDQHAAHERIMYEEIRDILNGSEPMVQILLSPVMIELSPSEWQILKSNFSYFDKLGIEIEEFGSCMVVVRSMPVILLESDIAGFIQEGINRIIKGGSSSLYSDESIYQMACKAAVKANMKLDMREIQELIKRLSMLKNPFTCPHGRPIITEMTKYEVEKRFKRV